MKAGWDRFNCLILTTKRGLYRSLAARLLAQWELCCFILSLSTPALEACSRPVATAVLMDCSAGPAKGTERACAEPGSSEGIAGMRSKCVFFQSLPLEGPQISISIHFPSRSPSLSSPIHLGLTGATGNWENDPIHNQPSSKIISLKKHNILISNNHL